jgi:hypothetical protein
MVSAKAKAINPAQTERQNALNDKRFLLLTNNTNRQEPAPPKTKLKLNFLINLRIRSIGNPNSFT